MPKGVYDRRIQHLSNTEFLLYLLSYHDQWYGSDLVDRMRHRCTRRETYNLLRTLIADEKIMLLPTRTGNMVYRLKESPHVVV